MRPEASASGRLTLYRAERLPDRWARAAVLLDGMAVSDATLLEQGGRFWLFRDGPYRMAANGRPTARWFLHGFCA